MKSQLSTPSSSKNPVIKSSGALNSTDGEYCTFFPMYTCGTIVLLNCRLYLFDTVELFSLRLALRCTPPPPPTHTHPHTQTHINTQCNNAMEGHTHLQGYRRSSLPGEHCFILSKNDGGTTECTRQEERMSWGARS